MKFFRSLLVAPATIGLLAPFSTFAGETSLDDISKYSNLEHIDFANAFVNDEPNFNPLLAGGEGLLIVVAMMVVSQKQLQHLLALTLF